MAKFVLSAFADEYSPMLDEQIEGLKKNGIGYMEIRGVDPAARIEMWKDKIAVTHFKDMRIEADTQKFAAVGEGNMNFDRIVAASKAAGIKYHMVEQDTVPEGVCPFDCLETSYKNVMARYGADFE